MIYLNNCLWKKGMKQVVTVIPLQKHIRKVQPASFPIPIRMSFNQLIKWILIAAGSRVTV